MKSQFTPKIDDVYVKHILDAIEAIEEYVNGLTYLKFTDDSKTVDAVIRQIEIIGEASNKISRKLRSEYKEIPWQLIIGMRNKLVHEYFGVNVDAVWDTVKHDLPDLKKKINEIIK